MKDLSITQEYLLCSLTEKGTLPTFHTEPQVCLVAGALLELWMEQCIVIEDKKVTVTNALPVSMVYLKSLYDYLSEKPRPLKKVAEDYNFTFTDKRLNQLIDSLGDCLVKSGYATLDKGGLLGAKNCYLPDKNKLEQIIQNVRKQLLEDGELTEDIIVLASLLEKGKQMKGYFSNGEKTVIKKRIAEIRQSDSNKVIKEMLDYINNLLIILCVIS